MTTPRPLGVYAIEWAPTAERDDVLGRLGGVFHGTVMEYLPGRELFIADAWWLPPDDEPIGPMALEVSCMLEAASCRLMRQSGFDDSPRWRRCTPSSPAGGNRRWHRSRSIWSADPSDVKEVGVGPIVPGLTLMNTTTAPADKRPRSTSRRTVDVAFRDDRRDSPQQRERAGDLPSGIAARIGAAETARR